MGALGRAAVRRTAGGGSLHGESIAWGVYKTAGARTGDGVEPDAVGVLSVDTSGPGACGGGSEAEVAVGDLRRRSAGVEAAAEVVRAARRESGAGEHVRDHGDDGARQLHGVEQGDS